jgi:hypothetical protein
MPQVVDDPTLDQLCDQLTITSGYVQLVLLFLVYPPDQPLDAATIARYLRRALWANARLAATLRGESFTAPCPQ